MWPWKKPEVTEELCLRALQDQINDLRACGIESENVISNIQHRQACAASHGGQHPLIFKEVRSYLPVKIVE